jgi:hypothetical protein
MNLPTPENELPWLTLGLILFVGVIMNRWGYERGRRLQMEQEWHASHWAGTRNLKAPEQLRVPLPARSKAARAPQWQRVVSRLNGSKL